MYKIAVIGDYDSIYGFATLGLSICPVKTREDARKKLKQLADGQYGIIYITEAVAAQIEEEIFYPAFTKALKDTELVPEATVEHATLTYLIEQIKDVKPDGDLFDAKVKVLSEYVKHHVKEEQNEMFPKVKASKLDLKELGAQLAKRKAQLMAARN